MKQCCYWDRNKKEKEKSYSFTHWEYGSTYFHPYLNKRERMSTWEKEGVPHHKQEIKQEKSRMS